MERSALTLLHNGSELLAVPAIHFNHLFAREVYRVCMDPATRPEAIAVELGPSTTCAVARWLKELNDAALVRKKLPIMLGLLRRNRMIRASLRSKALQLQNEMGSDLSELSPEVLHRELGFSGCSLVCLSPSDSIIEAIRCGVELNLPIFGVDLDDVANGTYRSVLVQDPTPYDDLTAYVRRNAGPASHERDEEVDGRREMAMAARLKTLLEQHRKVIFTGGLAHWLRIAELLDDTSIRAATMPEVTLDALNEFRRVIVHPLLATECMDLFPPLAVEYEKWRTSRRLRRGRCTDEDINPAAIFRARLIKAYNAYFCPGKKLSRHVERHGDLDRLHAFEAYLSNLSLLDHRSVPDFFTIMQAAREMMSNAFAEVVSEAFMDVAWAKPQAFPGYALLRPALGQEETGQVVVTEPTGKKSLFYVRTVHTAAGSSPAPKIPFSWSEDGKGPKDRMTDHSLHTWLPWDRFITALSVRAMERATRNRALVRPAKFEGSLLEGIDTKSTMRAFSRGEGQFYVREPSKGKDPDQDLTLDFPVVWIFEAKDVSQTAWTVLREPCSYMERYVRDRRAFNRVAQERGSNMTALVAYGRRSDVRYDSSVKSERYQGILLYQPICWTNEQFARWAESTGYCRNPFFESGFFDYGLGIVRKILARYQMKADDGAHPSTILLLAALPFAKQTLHVVAPAGYEVDRTVLQHAKRFGVEVLLTPLSMFSQKDVDRVSLCYLVPVITHDPWCIYPRSVEKQIGEHQTDNIDLVPQWVLDFGTRS